MTPLLSPLAALGSAATLGIADFSGGLAGRRTPAPSVTVGIELCGLVMLPLATWLLPLGWDVRAAFLAFMGGTLGGLGLIAFYRAMAHNLIGVVAPITEAAGAAMFATAAGASELYVMAERDHPTYTRGPGASKEDWSCTDPSPAGASRKARKRSSSSS